MQQVGATKSLRNNADHPDHPDHLLLCLQDAGRLLLSNLSPPRITVVNVSVRLTDRLGIPSLTLMDWPITTASTLAAVAEAVQKKSGTSSLTYIHSSHLARRHPSYSDAGIVSTDIQRAHQVHEGRALPMFDGN